MVDLPVTYALGTVGMLLGTLAIAVGLRHKRHSARNRYLALVGVTGIASVAYALMLFGIGTLQSGQGVVFVPRYVDWLLTTPLLIYYVGRLAGASRSTLGRAVLLDAIVILLGFVGTLTAPPVKWIAFGVAALAFLALAWLLSVPMSRRARERAGDDRALFRKLRNVIVVLWSVYPLVWFVGTPGLGVMQPATMAVVIAYLDLLTKVGFGLIVLNARGAFDGLWRDTLSGADAAETR